MIILIAESKTMLGTQDTVTAQEFEAHKPIYEANANHIMESLSKFSASELGSMLKLSSGLTVRMKSMIYDFGFKNTGNPAIMAYTGVVFKSLDYGTLNSESTRRCDERVRIISSLYGWLRPSDVIKPYRLDFTSRPAEGPAAGLALNQFWKKDVTKALVKTLQTQGENEILNLLPGDASKCIDWKLVKRFAKVWKIDFQEFNEGGEMKTPRAEKLKSMRGSLLRQILEEDVRNADELLKIVSEKYICEGAPVYPDHLRFLC